MGLNCELTEHSNDLHRKRSRGFTYNMFTLGSPETKKITIRKIRVVMTLRSPKNLSYKILLFNFDFSSVRKKYWKWSVLFVSSLKKFLVIVLLNTRNWLVSFFLKLISHILYPQPTLKVRIRLTIYLFSLSRLNSPLIIGTSVVQRDLSGSLNFTLTWNS